MPSMPLGAFLIIEDDFADRLRRIREAGFPTMQVYPSNEEFASDPKRAEVRQLICDSGIAVTSVGVGSRELVFSDFAHCIGSPHVFAHFGKVPQEREGAEYEAALASVREVCDFLHARGQVFCIETGPEKAATLRRFILDIERENVRVNFDPANWLIYGTDEPMEALDILAPWVAGVHCKDAVWPTESGEYGEERRLGEGLVGIERFLAKLKEIGYQGALTIEREISGEEQMQDFFAAKKLLEDVKGKLEIE